MQVATKKIRVYLSEPRKVDRQIDYSRRAYNLCVACYRKWVKGDPPVDFTQLRRTIREVVKAEANGDAIGTTHLDEACAEVKRANQAVIRKRVKGQKSELAFRKKSATKQGFIYQRLPSTGLLKVLGEAYLTESIPPEAIKHSARLTREYGRYFLITKRFIPTAAAEIQGNAVGVDPGVRTFATTFATDVVTKLGEDFQKEKLRPLGIKLDQLYSKRKKLFNRWASLGDQLRNDLLRCYTRKINRLKARRQDLISDLHRRVCYYLVTNYDFIFLPSFRVKQMTSKAKRKIGSKVVRGMMDLCHYKFRLMLTWMAKKYGKTLIEVNEAYTSKTQSWNGKISKAGLTISDGSLIVDRDINGARGIFLRAVTR
jgi:putative transposase